MSRNSRPVFSGQAAPITPFERKYLASGHALWRCRVELP